jgi:phage shock protein A
MDMALSNVDTQGMKIEEEAEKIRASELLKQFKQEMGLEAPAESAGGAKTLGPGTKVGV